MCEVRGKAWCPRTILQPVPCVSVEELAVPLCIYVCKYSIVCVCVLKIEVIDTFIYFFVYLFMLLIINFSMCYNCVIWVCSIRTEHFTKPTSSLVASYLFVLDVSSRIMCE